MPESKQYVKVFEDCRVVNGATRSLIYDFTRKQYYPISLAQSELIAAIDRQPVEKLETQFDIPHVKSFFDFLKEKELIFLCSKEELDFFPGIANQWYSASTISNLILFRSAQSTSDWMDHLPALSDLGLKHVQLFLENEIPFERLRKWTESLSEAAIKSIEIFSSLADARELVKRANELAHTQITTLTLTDADTFKILKSNPERQFNIMYLKNRFEEVYSQQPPDPGYFNVDIRQYMEAQAHNVYFNEKLILDSSDQILTNVNETAIGRLGKVDLKQWKQVAQLPYASKDTTETCRDCEYRYMCTDSRTPLRHKDEWRYEQSCNYDPYRGEWQTNSV